MDFSSHWKSTFPSSSLTSPPTLLSPSSPLHFTPHSPPFPLITSPSLLPHLPPLPSPPLHLHSLHSFLASQSPHSTSLLPSIYSLSPPLPSTNLLISLPSHYPNTLHLFFPTGENSDSLAFLSVSFSSNSAPVLTLDPTGEVFVQSEGLKHKFHRINSLSAVQTPALNANQSSDGFLLATTLYSVNWFWVETRELESDKDRTTRVSKSGKWNPVLVPLGNHGFEFPVLHACFSSHFSEESLVLLENGDLYRFDLKLRKCSKIRVRLNGENDSVKWLSCEFGAKPWLVLVASSKGVILIDLRDGGQGQNCNLCEIGNLGLYDVNPIEERSEKILAFCKSRYFAFHFSVLTEFQLMVFDTRWVSNPVLTWDHGLQNPNFVSMFELDQLGKNSENSEKGFAILAGSFCTGQFNLFCYGIKNELEASSSFKAWGLPSRLSLSSQSCQNGEDFVSDLFSKEGVFVKDFEFMRKNEKVLGFCVVPKDLSLIEPGLSGFTLIRLLSFGRLELQNYCIQNEEICKQNGILKPCDILTVCPNCEREKLPSRRYFLDLKYLNAYLNGDLSETLNTNNSELLTENPLSENLSELIKDSINHTSSLSTFVNNASIPTNLFEIAILSGLNNLKPELLPLAFGNYSDLFANSRGSNFQLLQVSRNASEMETLFHLKPFRRAQKWSGKTEPPKESLVGPVLPVPVLLSLDERESVGTDSILDQKCVEIMEIVSPPISIAETEDPNENNSDKDFFVYEPQFNNNVRNNEMVCRNEKYETFICGVNNNNNNNNKSGEINGVKPKTELGAIEPGFFDLGEIKLDFGSREIEVQSSEKEALEKLKNQFSDWMNDCKPYQDFLINSKIPK
ncbi:hypothetical protein LUZ60_008477 [Juncus effusus]|nr:hypothetical protein LUZ60_008477 [Juncus effusus]